MIFFVYIYIETPGTMSPPHSVFIAESPDAYNRQPVPHDEKAKVREISVVIDLKQLANRQVKCSESFYKMTVDFLKRCHRIICDKKN